MIAVGTMFEVIVVGTMSFGERAVGTMSLEVIAVRTMSFG